VFFEFAKSLSRRFYLQFCCYAKFWFSDVFNFLKLKDFAIFSEAFIDKFVHFNLLLIIF